MLVLLLGFNSFGLPFFYWAKIQLCKIKAEYAETEKEEASKTIVVFSSKEKAIQQVNSKELLVDGKMYDIVKTRIRKGVIFYYAVGDDDEDAYIHNLADVEKGDSGANSLPVKMLKLYEVKYVAVAEKHSAVNFSYEYTSNFSVINTPFFHPAHFKDILSPPPDLSLS